MDVVSILGSRNRCLRRLLDVSEKFLGAAQGGDFSSLDPFQEERNSAIKALEMYDRKISEAIKCLPLAQRTAALTNEVKATLDEKERLLQSIISTDNRILVELGKEKDRVQEQLANSRKNEATLKKFKSTWARDGGDEVDVKL